MSRECKFGPDRDRRLDTGGAAQSATPYGRLRRGLYVDCETTGFSSEHDAVIELALLPFTYTLAGTVVEVLHNEAQAHRNDPGRPLPAEITHLTLLAAARGVPVIAEDLDFRRKKAWLKQYGRRFAEVLSLFRSKQVLSAVERQCRRRGVELIVVDPGWTTKIAKEGRYPDRYRIGLHHAAALVIGRRGLGFAERVPTAASPPVRAEVKRRGTRGWESTLVQWLPGARRQGRRRGTTTRPGARKGPVGTSSPRPDGPAGVVASRGAVAPAKATCVRTVA